MNTQLLIEQAQAAREAGFTAAATELEKKAARAVKLAVAYEHYRYVSKEQVAEFNKKLKTKTERFATEQDAANFANRSMIGYASNLHDELTFVAMGDYKGLPPGDVFGKVKEAKGRQCFDGFTVAEVNPVSTQVKLPDPIVFGQIEGCTDLFFIAEWGSDVKITDLLKENEG